MSPWAPRRPCVELGCPELVTGPVSRCPRHLQALRRRQDATRPSPSARGYGYAWRKLRAAILERDGNTCTEPGCGALATEVDHVIPKHAGGTDDPGNLRALCRYHHASRTGRQRQRLRFPAT
jgi:5-methylcytosine-specific restriction protein A